MPNLSMTELLMILLIGLLVFGPHKLPEIARNFGKAWRMFQEESRKARSVLTESLGEETRAIKDAMSEVGVIDHPDGAKKPPAPAKPKKPSPKAIERAAAIEPSPERALEDT